ncbi:DUF3857 domain-containing transglutaminase family protein [Tahibacter caeni]|uniref:DUF3857 domain-containing transglutaminase family protein n=1 Tax=Tahibacter caeni TaxID=1453545 RepID=UPI00214803E0|nr:DUF3857 domain-containing transglutaminase family protein [Tahibacter caeni]
MVALAFAARAEEYVRGEFRFAVAPPADWVETQPVAEHWDEQRLPSAGKRWRNWLYDAQYARFGGRRERYQDVAYEATSPALLGEVGKVEIDFRPDFERLTIHEISLRRDGRWSSRLKPEAITLARRESEFERDMALGSVSAMAVLDDVRVGDVVRVRYSVNGENPILAGLDHVGGRFALNAPLLARQLRVLFDRDARPSEQRDAGVAAPRVTRGPKYLEWRYRAEAVAEIVAEDRNPVWFSPYPQVSLSEKRDWAAVAAWARALYPPPAPLPADLAERIAQWRRLPDAQARIAAALLAVQEEVRYFGVEIGDNTHRPREPAEVWEQRRGDCKDKSRLLVTILAALDVPAFPALVSAGSGKRVAELPPSAGAFDHVIVQVRSDKGVLWLDPTRTAQRGPALAQEIGDFGFALPVAADTKGLVAVVPNPANHNRTRVRERYEPRADGSELALEIRAEYAGDVANLVRAELRYNGSEAMARRYADFYRRRFPELDAAAPLAVEDDADANRLVLTERYRVLKPWSASSPGQRALDLDADSIAGALSLPATLQRHTPLALTYPNDIAHRIELVLPSGWRWTGSSAERELDDPAAQYRYRAGVDAGTVFSEESVVVRADSVPVERMAAHLDWRRAAREQNLQRWVLALPAAEADQARKARLNDLVRGVINDNKKAKKARGDE